MASKKVESNTTKQEEKCLDSELAEKSSKSNENMTASSVGTGATRKIAMKNNDCEKKEHKRHKGPIGRCQQIDDFDLKSSGGSSTSYDDIKDFSSVTKARRKTTKKYKRSKSRGGKFLEMEHNDLKPSFWEFPSMSIGGTNLPSSGPEAWRKTIKEDNDDPESLTEHYEKIFDALENKLSEMVRNSYDDIETPSYSSGKAIKKDNKSSESLIGKFMENGMDDLEAQLSEASNKSYDDTYDALSGTGAAGITTKKHYMCPESPTENTLQMDDTEEYDSTDEINPRKRHDPNTRRRPRSSIPKRRRPNTDDSDDTDASDDTDETDDAEMTFYVKITFFVLL